MIRIEETEVVGWKHAIRGMRNPMNSWDKSDSRYGCHADMGRPTFCVSGEKSCIYWIDEKCYINSAEMIIGMNDMELMKKLSQAGTDHRKFLRMIVVYCDITAPLYWWKEYDTYKVGTVANSCSTMHKIHDRDMTLDDFSYERMTFGSREVLIDVICELNCQRRKYVETKDKKYWDSLIQLLPTSYNQKRTVMLNYEVLSNIYKSRKNHKLDEWRELCKWIESLPYSQLITGKEGEADGKPEDHEGDCEANSGGITVLPEQ